MGKRFSPSMANIYMIDLESQAINHDPTILQLYKRYLDDIFFIWNGDLTSLKHLETFLNLLEQGIQIKLKWYKEEIDFLDITIFKDKNERGNTTLRNKPFFKVTDSHQLLHIKSFHPRHTSIGVLKSQLLRFKRLTSIRFHYNEACRTLFKTLVTRGYSQRKMFKLKFEIWYRDEGEALERIKEKELKPIFAVVNKYNAFNIKLSKQWIDILKGTDVGKNFRCIQAYSNYKNIYQMILAQKRERKRAQRDPIIEIIDNFLFD